MFSLYETFELMLHEVTDFRMKMCKTNPRKSIHNPGSKKNVMDYEDLVGNNCHN